MNAEYTVFIDESFFKWFGLPVKESNICYGALSLPKSRLKNLERFEKSIRQYAFDRLPASEQASHAGGELKYTAFRHFTPTVIDELGGKLDYFLSKNGAAIFGFFIPAEGLFNYHLRSDYIDDAKALRTLPEVDYKKRISEIRDGMLKKWEDAEHNLGLLEELYPTFFNFVVQYHGHYLKKPFQIVYDSRHPEEDAELHKCAEDFARQADRATPGAFSHYRGYSTASSANSAGLRLVDWIAGEVRSFFYHNPVVVGGDSNPLLLQISGLASC